MHVIWINIGLIKLEKTYKIEYRCRNSLPHLFRPSPPKCEARRNLARNSYFWKGGQTKSLLVPEQPFTTAEWCDWLFLSSAENAIFEWHYFILSMILFKSLLSTSQYKPRSLYQVRNTQLDIRLRAMKHNYDRPEADMDMAVRIFNNGCHKNLVP